jgi:hypothetical protein
MFGTAFHQEGTRSMTSISFRTILAGASFAMFLGAAPVFAADEAETTFRHGADTYVYSVDQQDDRRVIEGKRYPGGSDFRLIVRNGKVAGTVDGHDVSFPVSAAQGAAVTKTTRVSLR